MLKVNHPNFLIRLSISAFGWIVGLFFYFTLILWRLTLRLPDQKNVNNLLYSRYVLALWHEDLILYFLLFPKMYRQVWMNHPAWFMKPVHVVLKLQGAWEIILGSSGNSGKKAMHKLIHRLNEGCNTVVAVDGPAGPPGIAKPGASIMSKESGLPLVWLHVKPSRFFRIAGWDRKRVPFPFSIVKCTFGEKAPLFS